MICEFTASTVTLSVPGSVSAHLHHYPCIQDEDISQIPNIQRPGHSSWAQSQLHTAPGLVTGQLLSLDTESEPEKYTNGSVPAQHRCSPGTPAVRLWNCKALQSQTRTLQTQHTVKASIRSQAGSLQRLCNTSVPQPSMHPRVDVLPRLLHHSLAHDQLMGKKKAGEILLYERLQKREAPSRWTQQCWCHRGWEFPQSHITAQVLGFKRIFTSFPQVALT